MPWWDCRATNVRAAAGPSLGSSVQRGYRFVAHHELGIEEQRACDPDALALTAGELVRIALHAISINPFDAALRQAWTICRLVIA
jgi:hypothetical protein